MKRLSRLTQMQRWCAVRGGFWKVYDRAVLWLLAALFVVIYGTIIGTGNGEALLHPRFEFAEAGR